MKDKRAYDRYWRLDDHTQQNKCSMRDKIHALGYSNVKDRLTKKDLSTYLERQDKGLLCYEKCSNDEIRAFANARDILCWVGDDDLALPDQRSLTIDALMEDDGDPRFSKFLDLPAELRQRIYEYYDAEFEDILVYPTKPPLAQTCHQLYQEVLPVFYSKHEFAIDVIRDRRDDAKFREHETTHMWLSQLSPAHAASIRRLQILVTDKFNGRPKGIRTGLVGRIWISLNEDCGECSHKIRKTDSDAFNQIWDTDRMNRLHDEFEKLLGRLQRVGERKRFKLQDIHDLRKAVSAGYE